MVHLQAEEGYFYNCGDELSNDIYCPNEEEAAKWTLITKTEADVILERKQAKLEEELEKHPELGTKPFMKSEDIEVFDVE